VTTRRCRCRNRHIIFRNRDAVDFIEGKGVLGRLDAIPCLGKGLSLESVRMDDENECEIYLLALLSVVRQLVLRRIVEEQPC
jgi:hypothetical protein